MARTRVQAVMGSNSQQHRGRRSNDNAGHWSPPNHEDDDDDDGGSQHITGNGRVQRVFIITSPITY
jgi:hypothetical protein